MRIRSGVLVQQFIFELVACSLVSTRAIREWDFFVNMYPALKSAKHFFEILGGDLPEERNCLFRLTHLPQYLGLIQENLSTLGIGSLKSTEEMRQYELARF